MLAPRASSAFVCLRCELKLARPRTSTPPIRFSHASFSSSAHRHDAAEEGQTLEPSEAPSKDSAEQTSLRISKEFVRKGKLVRQRKAKLGMKRMDEDAHVLVLNEAPIREDHEEQPEVLEPIPVPDILSTLQQDSAPATQEDVEKQLASLRPIRGNPDETQYVSTADFIKLVAALTRGFTTPQLSGYYSTAKSIKKNAVYKTVQATVQATKRSAWHPTTTDIKKRLPGVETVSGGKQKPRSIRKATLVDKILRDVWKLELLEEIESSGELELRLKDWQLKLLQIGGNGSALARIASIRNAKVEIHWPNNVLRITADKNTAEYTADDVEAALSKARTKTLDLKRWSAQLDEAKLSTYSTLVDSVPADFVSSLTATHIVARKDHTLIIYGLDETSVAEARRSCIRLLPFKESVRRTIDTQRLDVAKDLSYLLPVFLDSTSLDYKYRHLSLGRWSLPVSRSTDPVGPEEQEQSSVPAEAGSASQQESHSIINRAVSLLMPPTEATFTSSDLTPQNTSWFLEPEYKLSAEFGQALFPCEMSGPDKVIEAASDSSRSPFHPVVPGLGSLLTSSTFENLSRMETPALLYDFLPSPDQRDLETSPGPDFPKLLIQVRTGRNGDEATLHKLSLGFQERVHDVLLPDQTTDIRFCRYGRLRFSSKSHHDKNVEKWLDAVRQNIEGGGRLSAPSLVIDIPKWIVPGFPSDAKGTVSVKYLFSGIQFRQTVQGYLMGTQVSYSTVQSGKLGAKGGALSAYSQTLNAAETETQIRDFATKCMRIVKHITQASAQNKTPKQSLRPRNDQSARKQQRRAAFEGHQADVLGLGQEIDQNPVADQQPELLVGLEHNGHLDDVETSLQNQEADTRLASRLDDAVAPTITDDALNEAGIEASEDRSEAKSKIQEQEADALLADLFGNESSKEPTAEVSSEHYSSRSEKS